MILILIITSLITFFAYMKKSPAWFLLGLSFMFTSGYLFIPSTVFAIKPHDCCLIIVLSITILEWIKNKNNYFKVKNDIIGSIVLCTIVFHVCVFLVTVFSGAEMFTYAFKSFRINLIYLLYFYIRKLPANELYNFWKINFFFCIIHGIAFYLQPLGVTGVLSGRIDEAMSSSDMTRYTNIIPIYDMFYFIWGVVCNKKILGKLAVIFFFGGMFILSMARGFLLMVSLGLIVYVLLRKRAKNYLIVCICGIIFLMVVKPMFSYRDATSNVSTLDDITNVVTATNLTTDSFEDGGNYTFRVAMVIERFAYLLDNPQYLLTGVGDIHEDSPNCHKRFRFIIGTYNEERQDIGQLGSVDVTWTAVVIKYGIVGTVLCVLLLLVWLGKSLKLVGMNNNGFVTASMVSSLSTIIGSFNTTIFDGYLSIVAILMYAYIVDTECSKLNKLDLIQSL